MRDTNLLDAAVGRMSVSIGRHDAYPDIWHKAAALFHSLIKNHPFVDGNKRTALTVLETVLAKNDVREKIPGKLTLETLVLLVAQAHMEVEDIVLWLQENYMKG